MGHADARRRLARALEKHQRHIHPANPMN
jgi:hypothetical protein